MMGKFFFPSWLNNISIGWQIVDQDPGQHLNPFFMVSIDDVADVVKKLGDVVKSTRDIIKQRTDIEKLRNNIRKLKADCEKVGQLRDKLDTRTRDRSWGSLFGLLGAKEEKRTLELHGTISNFYAEDERMIELFEQTLDLAEKEIKDVEGVLGPPDQQTLIMFLKRRESLGLMPYYLMHQTRNFMNWLIL